jgi:hypothetical protein
MHGAAYVPESVYPANAVKVARGTPVSWTLKRNPRFTCPTCGTRLFIDVLAREIRPQWLPAAAGTVPTGAAYALQIRATTRRG